MLCRKSCITAFLVEWEAWPLYIGEVKWDGMSFAKIQKFFLGVKQDDKGEKVCYHLSYNMEGKRRSKSIWK